MSNARERKQIGLKTAELRILKLEEKTMLRLADQIRDQLNRLKIEEYEIKSQINAQKQAQIQCSIVQQSTSHLTKQNEYNLPETIPALQPITRHFAKQGEYTLPETIPALQPIIQNQQTELVDLDLTVHSSGLTKIEYDDYSDEELEENECLLPL